MENIREIKKIYQILNIKLHQMKTIKNGENDSYLLKKIN